MMRHTLRAGLLVSLAFGLALAICDAKPSHAASVKRIGSAMRLTGSRPSSAAGGGSSGGRRPSLGGNATARVVPHECGAPRGGPSKSPPLAAGADIDIS